LSGFVGLEVPDHAGASQRVFELIGRSFDVGARCQASGGVLLHGALAVRGSAGVLLLGPSGRGKTTASGRLMPPWTSLSDDMALAMPQGAGAWGAHPWPTWARYLNGEGGCSWDLHRSVGLRGLFILVRAPEDRVERIGPGRASCLLLESFEQAWVAGSSLMSDAAMKGLRGRAFLNISSLAKAVPAFLLHLSPAGPFWERLDEALDGGSSRG